MQRRPAASTNVVAATLSPPRPTGSQFNPPNAARTENAGCGAMRQAGGGEMMMNKRGRRRVATKAFQVVVAEAAEAAASTHLPATRGRVQTMRRTRAPPTTATTCATSAAARCRPTPKPRRPPPAAARRAALAARRAPRAACAVGRHTNATTMRCDDDHRRNHLNDDSFIEMYCALPCVSDMQNCGKQKRTRKTLARDALRQWLVVGRDECAHWGAIARRGARRRRRRCRRRR